MPITVALPDVKIRNIVWMMMVATFLLWPTLGHARFQVLEPKQGTGDTKRMALVIGNAAYRSVTALKNTTNDAGAVADSARDLGYRVFLALDLDRSGMNRVISEFLRTIDSNTEVLFYYAGHGVELQGSNYLFPIDVPLLSSEQDRLLRSEAISLSDLLQDFELRSARVTLVILDACRDNPFAGPGKRSLGNTRGLGRVDPPSGTFVIYAAGAGEAALDSLGAKDTDRNGLFTRSLLKHMNREGLELRSMVRELRQEVRQAALTGAGHSQTPSYYDQLLGDFYFRPRSMEPPATLACAALVSPNASRSDILFNDYPSILLICERELQSRPADARLVALVGLAREQRAFQAALTSNHPAPAAEYLRKFPSGRYLEGVRQYLASLDPRPSPGPEINPPPRPAPTPVDAVALARSLQAELKRAGCYGGTVDGVWGNMSRRAVSEFARFASLELPGEEPSQTLLDMIQPFGDRVCPLTCDARHEARGEQCVLKICGAGQVLSTKGICVRRQAERKVERKPAGGGGNCFNFNGVRHCD